MTKVLAGITTSVDGYVAGPDDGPGKGLGEGGERLHYWVFGGPWTYDDPPKGEPTGEPTGEDAEWLAEAISRIGAVVGGRRTYEASGRWGGKNPWGLPFFIVTHRPEEEPEGGAFTFVSGVEEAVERAKEAAGDKDVHVMGGADVIRQALAAGLVDELTIIVAPVVLGGGKHLFEGFSTPLELEHLGVRQSSFATFVDYRVKRR
jgi:dihydrofolate reductase